MTLVRIVCVVISFVFVACATPNNIRVVSTPSDVATNPSTEEKFIEFNFPLSEYKRVSRGYKGRHRGVDISAHKGTPIYAAESGWVTYQGRRFRGYGKLVILEHSSKWATFYAHMTKFALKEGTWVNKGDIIGYVGSTGRSTGAHLHFEIRFDNKPIDPMPYFNASSLKYSASANP